MKKNVEICRAEHEDKKEEPSFGVLPVKPMTSNVKFRGSYQKNDPN